MSGVRGFTKSPSPSSLYFSVCSGSVSRRWWRVSVQSSSSWKPRNISALMAHFNALIALTFKPFFGEWLGETQPRATWTPEQVFAFLAPDWLQSGSLGEAPKPLWRVFCKGKWEITQIYSTLALTPPLPATLPFRRLIRFCFTSFHPSQSHQSVFLLPSTPWALIFDSECGTAMC